MTDKSDLIAWLKKASSAVYLACEAPVADDISDGMKKAATALEAKDKELAALRESDSDKKRLLDLQEVAYRNMKASAETAERQAKEAEEKATVSFRCAVGHQDGAKELEAKLATAERERDEAREAQYLLDWFSKHPKLELSFGGWDEDHDAEWSVHSVGGSRNDREWTLLANRSTPLEAIRAARAITGKD